MKVLLSGLFTLVAIAFPALARDVYVFQGHSEGPVVYEPDAGTEIVEWDTDVFFFNLGASDELVTLLDEHSSMGFTIPAQHSLSLSSVVPRPFGLVHASVPDSVSVENVLFIGEVPLSILPTSPSYRYGAVRLPIFASFTPGNQPQVHLATFLGSQPSHINVWIYNAGDVPATARVAVRRQCDDTVIDERLVTIGAKTATVVGGLGQGFPGCPITPNMLPWTPFSTYTVVTVDQPSLSFASTVADGQIPKAMVTVN